MIDFILKCMPVLTGALFLCFVLSCFAPVHWVFAFLAQFKVQYIYGGLILALFLVAGSYWISLALVFVVVTVSFVQTRLPMAEPWQFFTSSYSSDVPSFQVVQYNKLYSNNDFDSLNRWLADEGRHTDVLVMQEVLDDDLPALGKAITPYLPYAMDTSIDRPDTVMVYSRTPISNVDVHDLCHKYCDLKGLRFDVESDLSPEPVRIYSAHTHLGFGKYNALAQSEQFEEIAEWITMEDAPMRVFVGDLNTTAQTPAFQKFLRAANMKHQRFGILPIGTWPRFVPFYPLQVSIDHIVFSHRLRLLNIERGPAFGSDHYSLVARFDIAP